MWAGLLNRVKTDKKPFTQFLMTYAAGNDITLTRGDVGTIFTRDAANGVIAAIFWSHPRGIRVNALTMLARDLPNLTDLMTVQDFGEKEMTDLLGFPGISVPTASKMLSGCGKTLCGMATAILDDAIIQLIETDPYADDFPSVHDLINKSRSRPVQYYQAYLRDVTALCQKHGMTADMLDSFLSEHALSLLAPDSALKSA